jgi:transcription antitermination protein NusB
LGTYSRSRCREWALQFLYQGEFSGPPDLKALEQFWEHFQDGGALPAYLKELVIGVGSHQEELDALIVRYSEHWRLERMTVVDRNLLRLAIYELLYQAGIPAKVVINEAVEMAKRYGSEASGGFINGILDQVRLSVGRQV